MNAKFWKGNKDIFLKYFENSGQWSASEIYDAMIAAGNFKEMDGIVQSKTNFNCEEFINKLKEEK